MFIKSLFLALSSVVVFSNAVRRSPLELAPIYNEDHEHRVRREISIPTNADSHAKMAGECTVDFFNKDDDRVTKEEVTEFLETYKEFVVKYNEDFQVVQMNIPEEDKDVVLSICELEYVEAFEYDVLVSLFNNSPDLNLIRVQSHAKPWDSVPLLTEVQTEKKFKGTDSGVSDHVEFGNRIDRSLGKNIVSSGSDDTTDCLGHGTHVAGTIAGSTVGIASEATIVPYKLFTCSGLTSSRTMLDALAAVLADIKAYPDRKIIINMSLGPTRPTVSESITNAERKIIELGGAIAKASGNSGADACLYNLQNFTGIAVAASDYDDKLTTFSNYGDCIDIIAPGKDIVSASNFDKVSYSTKDGTSMATPLVAGALAVFADVYDLKGFALQNALLEAATNDILDMQSNTETINKFLYVMTSDDKLIELPSSSSQTSISPTTGASSSTFTRAPSFTKVSSSTRVSSSKASSSSGASSSSSGASSTSGASSPTSASSRSGSQSVTPTPTIRSSSQISISPTPTGSKPSDFPSVRPTPTPTSSSSQTYISPTPTPTGSKPSKILETCQFEYTYGLKKKYVAVAEGSFARGELLKGFSTNMDVSVNRYTKFCYKKCLQHGCTSFSVLEQPTTFSVDYNF
eukprot:Awhi_evm1s2908